MGLGLLNANLFMKLRSYHGPKKKTLGALGPWAQGANFGVPGPWAHGPKRKTLGALGPSDLSLMALALFFSCIPCSGSLFCPFPNGPGPRPLAFLLSYNPCRPPGLVPKEPKGLRNCQLAQLPLSL